MVFGRRSVFKNFNLVAPKTGKVELLLAKPVGWFFSPAFSPSGDQVAVFWNRRRRGVWLVDMKTRAARLVAKGNDFPVRRSADGRWLYAVERDERSARGVKRIEVATGKLRPWLRLPQRSGRREQVIPYAGGQRFVINQGEERSDAWIVRP